MFNTTRRMSGFTLLEMLATVVIIGIAATLIVSRVATTSDDAKRNACFSHKGEIEIQVQRWWTSNGSPPNANLANIYADGGYFPEGGYMCPVDGSPYTIDTNTGEVIGHTH